jgi:predicted enzyme related to lactoylglutathione lyase
MKSIKGGQMGQPVVHFEVIGKDPDELRSYYGQLFGWTFGEPMGPTAYATVQEPSGIGGGVGGAPEGYGGHVTFYVQVQDVGDTLAQAESLGGRRMMGPDEVPGVGIVIGLLQDPESHVIGVMSPTGSGSNGSS